MLELEIVYKELSKPRLTVAVDRATLKIPAQTSKEDSEFLIEFSNKIVEALHPVEFTHRGQFKSGLHNRSIDMHFSRYPSAKTTTRFQYSNGMLIKSKTPSTCQIKLSYQS